MIPFQPADPFPLLDVDSIETAHAQSHADSVDRWLGLDIKSAESALAVRGCRSRADSNSRDHQELWIGLAIRSLLTPYVEIRALLHSLGLSPGQSVVDLGAAYGRMGFVIERHFPGVCFTGYEFVGERVEQARRCYVRHGLRASKMEHADLSAPDFRPIPADVYFLYDYGTPKAIEKTLHDLRRISLGRDLVLVARGKRCQEAIGLRHPWLLQQRGSASGTKCVIFKSRREAKDFDGVSMLVELDADGPSDRSRCV